MKNLLSVLLVLSCLSGVFAVKSLNCYGGCNICGNSEINWNLLVPNDVTQECYYNAAIDQWYWWLNEDSISNPGSAGAHSGGVNLYRTGIMGMGYEQAQPSITCCANTVVGANRWIYEDCGTCPGGLQGQGGCYCDTITGFTGSCRVGTITRTFSSYTPCAGTRLTLAQVITVVDRTPPYMGIPADVTVECQSNSSPLVTGFPYAYDRCDTAPPSISFADGAVTAGACTGAGSFLRVWTAVDNCPGSGSNVQTQTISIVDTIPPTFTSLPADTSFQCAALVPAPPAITATDTCSAATVANSPVTVGKTCTNNFKNLVTYTARDSCGNTVSHLYTVTVADTLPPVITGIVDGAFTSQPCPPALPAVSATDNCDGNLTPTLLTTTIPVTGQFGVYDVQRRATVTDACGNTATAADTVRYSLTAAVSITGGTTINSVVASGTYTLASTIANGGFTCTYNTGDFFVYFEPYPFQFTPIAGCDTRSQATGEIRCKLTSAQLAGTFSISLTAPSWLLTTGQSWKINVAIGSETYANTGTPIVTTFILNG